MYACIPELRANFVFMKSLSLSIDIVCTHNYYNFTENNIDFLDIHHSYCKMNDWGKRVGFISNSSDDVFSSLFLF